jgi:hypothetical protein
MEINLNTISKKEIKSTGDVKSMSMSNNVQGIIFKMFTSNIYSNPIGTVVREITSNCFDSHIEAGVNKPVVIKQTVDAETDTRYISFIDFGVGMSKQRIEEIYTVYFESSKRNNNDEIGGFGIGGKTPLAYKRYSHNGNGDYDNSFFVITNYNGVKYQYTIFEGEKSPQYILLSEEPTTEGNGTEIKIPILDNDVYKFETEIIKQLYYFENLIFEGFSDRVTNDYKIYKGTNFIYRGNGVNDFMHVCLGKVAYPIDYSILDIDKYKFKIPVAINVPIGDINVVASREQLDYSEETIQYLKTLLNKAVDEIKDLLSKQNDKIVSLADFYNNKQNMFNLYLYDDVYIPLSNILSIKDIKLNKFKFKDKHIPEFNTLFRLILNKKRYGVVERKRYRTEKYQVFKDKFNEISNLDNVFYLDTDDNKINRRTSSYLKTMYGRFYIITKKDYDKIINNFDLTFILKDNSEPYIKTIIDELWKTIVKYGTDFNTVVVPDDFTTRNIAPKNKYINIKFGGDYEKEKILISDLAKFRGTIFYIETAEHDDIRNASNLFKELFGYDHIVSTNKFNNPKRNIMFISLAKNNVKYLKHCVDANVQHINNGYFKLKFLTRKEDIINEYFKNLSILDKFDSLNSVYYQDGFNNVDLDTYNLAKKVKQSISIYNNKLKDYDLKYKDYIIRQLNFEIKYDYNKKDKQAISNYNDMKLINDVNSKTLDYIRVSTYGQLSDTVCEILKKVLVF